MAERHAIVSERQEPATVIEVVEINEGETFVPPTQIEGWRSVEVPEGLAVAEGWTWTEEGGLKAP